MAVYAHCLVTNGDAASLIGEVAVGFLDTELACGTEKKNRNDRLHNSYCRR